MMINGKQNTYTLIELLMVLSIFTLAAVAVTTVAGGGIKIYRRAEFVSSFQTDLLLGMERLERELRNAQTFDTIGFSGTPQSIAFPGMVFRRDAYSGRLLRSPGRIIYRLDPAGQALMRTVQTYAEATVEDGGRGGESKTLAEGITRLRFEYCRYDAETETFMWQSGWDEDDDGIPSAVRIRLEAGSPGGISTIERDLLLPGAFFPYRLSVGEADSGVIK